MQGLEPAQVLGGTLDAHLLLRRYGVIRSLLRVLVDGQAAKDVLDVAIDANSAMQNLREAIAGAHASPCRGCAHSSGLTCTCAPVQ